MQSDLKIESVLSLFIGGFIGIVGQILMARAIALPIPSSLVDYAADAGQTRMLLWLWDIFVVHGLSVGVPGFVVALLSFRFLLPSAWLVVLLFVTGFALYIHIFSALAIGGGIFFPGPAQFSWYVGVYSNLLVAVVLALLVVRKLWHGNAAGPILGNSQGGQVR